MEFLFYDFHPKSAEENTPNPYDFTVHLITIGIASRANPCNVEIHFFKELK